MADVMPFFFRKHRVTVACRHSLQTCHADRDVDAIPVESSPEWRVRLNAHPNTPGLVRCLLGRPYVSNLFFVVGLHQHEEFAQTHP
jgi:hypothetical protein